MDSIPNCRCPHIRSFSVMVTLYSIIQSMQLQNDNYSRLTVDGPNRPLHTEYWCTAPFRLPPPSLLLHSAFPAKPVASSRVGRSTNFHALSQNRFDAWYQVHLLMASEREVHGHVAHGASIATFPGDHAKCCSAAKISC